MNLTPHVAITTVLLALLTVVAWYDTRSFRIPNFVTIPGVVLGVALNALLPFGLGFSSAAYGFALGLFALMPLYLLWIWGAGDVKLMAVVGAFLGPVGLIGAALASMVAGGVTALFTAWHRRTGKLLLTNLQCMFYQLLFNLQLRTAEPIDAPAQGAGKVAYAVPILLGTTAYLIHRNLG